MPTPLIDSEPNYEDDDACGAWLCSLLSPEALDRLKASEAEIDALLGPLYEDMAAKAPTDEFAGFSGVNGQFGASERHKALNRH